VIPKRTAAQADYARLVRLGGTPEQVADAKALFTAARLKEQILAALAKSPIDPEDAAELAALLRGQTDDAPPSEVCAVLPAGARRG
jgi:hypothetical protein